MPGYIALTNRRYVGLFFLILIFLSFFFLDKVLAADILEIKDKGFINGEIVSEDNEIIEFKDSYGNQRQIPKINVLSRQKSDTPKEISVSKKGASKGDSDAQKSAGAILDNAKKKVNDIVGNSPQQNPVGQAQAVTSGDYFSFRKVKTILSEYMLGVVKNHEVFLRWLKFSSFILGTLGFIYYFLYLVIQAFRMSFFWGLLFMFMPIGTVIFLVKQWEHIRHTFHKCVFFILMAIWPFLLNFFQSKPN